MSSLAFLSETLNVLVLLHVTHGHLFELLSLKVLVRLSTEFKDLKSNTFVVEFILFDLI